MGEDLSRLLMEECFWTFLNLQISASDPTNYTKTCINMKSWNFLHNFQQMAMIYHVKRVRSTQQPPTALMQEWQNM